VVAPGGHDLRAAGWAPVDPVEEAAHLGMAALAGVTADNVGQPGYAMERLQDRPVEHAPAVFAAGRAVAEGLELVCLVERAGEGMRVRR
jgi:hypothetical protein